MAHRETLSKCRLCRREGAKLFLKGSRCETAKCSISRREYVPGMHSWRRGRFSEYAVRLREKQKVKRYYGVREKQFRGYYLKATRQTGNTGENLLVFLERRLDNVLCHLGFAFSRRHARQLIGHGHITVNGTKVDIPSYLVEVNDVIRPKDTSHSIDMIKTNLQTTRGKEIPSWIEVTEEPPEGRIAQLPTRDQISLPIREQLIVEFCSR